MIEDQIQAIGDALTWIKKHKPEQYDQRFQQLVQERMKLRKVAAATSENPAIAAYGESQKGKSHVMNNLLLKNGQPYFVETPTGNVDFIADINPVGDNVEATGVVTRFSAFEKNGRVTARYKPHHPVLIKTLTPADLATILCDSYLNDVNKPDVPEKEEANDFARTIVERYVNNPIDPAAPIIEDDIFEIWNYLRAHIGPRVKALTNSDYFMSLASIVRRVPVSELPSVLQLLWNRNSDLTALYSRLLAAHEQLGFAREVYADIDAVRNKQNTIMAVACLAGLNVDGWQQLDRYPDPDKARYMDVYYTDAQGTEHKVTGMKKCEIAAICAEVVFKIDATNLETDVKYNLDSIPVESQAYISKYGVRKDILHSNDLLDFPGARPREKYPVNDLKVDIMIKRGKVAYLFYKYSEYYLFNVLLFCQDGSNPTVSEMYELIGDWVHTYIGKTPEERARAIERTQVPPIFVIGTKFNIDLKPKADQSNNDMVSLHQRWEDRFYTVLYAQSLKVETPLKDDLWFLNFTSADGRHPFDNCFVLRDFKYSSDLSGGNLYRGYNPADPTSAEREMMMSEKYYNDLRQSFITNENTKRFFSNPALAFDVAASMGNDGSQYIVERLTIVANKLNVARQQQLADEQLKICTRLVEIFKSYYVDEDADKLLRQNIRKSKKVRRELDFSVQSDNYFFGHMIERFQVTERETYGVLHDLITGTELVEQTNDFGQTELVLKRYEAKLKNCVNEAEKWDVLMDELVMDSREEVEEYLKRKGIDPVSIFSPSRKRRINSVIIADKAFDFWCRKMNSPSLLDELTGDDGFDGIVMSDLVQNIVQTSEQLGLSDRIATLIADYVNVLVPTTINESLVADLIATVINDFVNDLGYSYRLEQDRDKLRQLAQEMELPCFEKIMEARQETFTEEELTRMFDDFNENEHTVTPSFSFNYEHWLEYMLISFIGKSEVGDYDREANHQMGLIIEKARA